MKLLVELDYKTIKALSVLKVEGMSEIIEEYNKHFHRWVSNIDRTYMDIEYMHTHDLREDKLEYEDLLNLIIEDIKPLISEEQTKYIWRSMKLESLTKLINIKEECEDMLNKPNLYKSSLPKIYTFINDIVTDFNNIHRNT